MIEEAGKKLGKAARLQVGDAEQLPYKDNFLMWWFAMLPSTITRTRKRPLQKWAES